MIPLRLILAISERILVAMRRNCGTKLHHTKRNETKQIVTKLMNFGTLVKQLRIARRLTLRQCSAELGFDASNWSKMERGVTPPPRDIAILERLAGFFELAGEAKQEFFDQARLSRAELPADMASDERVLAMLPAYFRAARGGTLEREKPRQFIEDVRALHSPIPEA